MLKHLKPFGAKCSVFIPTSKRGTKSHSDRGQIGQFIGIEEDGIILYRVYLPATREIAVSSDVKFHTRESAALMDTFTTSPKLILPANAQTKKARMGDDIPEMDIDEFQYLVGTRHVDSVDGLLYETTRVLEEGQYIVGYRRLVLQDGTVFKRTEDGPIHVRDIAQMTELVGVPGAELRVEGVVATDPECVKPNHNYPDLGDACGHRGNSTPCGGDGRSNPPPALQSIEDKADTTHPLDRPLVVELIGAIPPKMRDEERAWNGNRKLLGSARGFVTTDNAKRVKVDSSITPTTQSEPITNSSPTLPNRCTTLGGVDAPQRGVVKGRKRSAQTAEETSHESIVRRPGLRPRVRQRLTAHAMAGNAFSTIAMILLTVTACTINGEIAIAPTAIQPDSLTRSQMIIKRIVVNGRMLRERKWLQ